MNLDKIQDDLNILAFILEKAVLPFRLLQQEKGETKL